MAKHLTSVQVAKLRNVMAVWLKGPRLRQRAALLTKLILQTGLRVNEARWLKWVDIYEDAKPPYVFVARGKGGRFRRVLIAPLFASILRVRRSLLSRRRRFVFPGRGRLPISKKTLQRDIHRIFAAAGICGKTVHSLRHTYATHLYAACGKDVSFVSRQLGHRDTRTTIIYIGTILRDVARALSALYKEKVS